MSAALPKIRKLRRSCSNFEGNRAFANVFNIMAVPPHVSHPKSGHHPVQTTSIVVMCFLCMVFTSTEHRLITTSAVCELMAHCYILVVSNTLINVVSPVITANKTKLQNHDSCRDEIGTKINPINWISLPVTGTDFPAIGNYSHQRRSMQWSGSG